MTFRFLVIIFKVLNNLFLPYLYLCPITSASLTALPTHSQYLHSQYPSSLAIISALSSVLLWQMECTVASRATILFLFKSTLKALFSYNTCRKPANSGLATCVLQAGCGPQSLWIWPRFQWHSAVRGSPCTTSLSTTWSSSRGGFLPMLCTGSREEKLSPQLKPERRGGGWVLVPAYLWFKLGRSGSPAGRCCWPLSYIIRCPVSFTLLRSKMLLCMEGNDWMLQ